MSKKDKWVRRFSVDETAQHKNGFTIYKITSVLFPLSSPEAVTIVKVWKRFSEARALHSTLKPLHSALQLRGDFPDLPRTRWTYYRRFEKEVIEERSKSIKRMLDFIAEHPLLFTSNQFVTFLQDGHTHPEDSQGVIRQICDELSVPCEEFLLPTPVTDQDNNEEENLPSTSSNNITPEEIKIFESTDIEFNDPPKNQPSLTDSFDSIDSLQSIDSDVFDDISKITIDNIKPSVKSKGKTRDLIDLTEASTSANNVSDDVSLNSVASLRSGGRMNITGEDSITEDSYIFEAGYLLNLAARSEESEDFGRAFDFYKSGIEKLLIGVQGDTDPARCALVKKKIDKYLAYAENIHKHHFQDEVDCIEHNMKPWSIQGAMPLNMIRGEYSDLANYRILGTVGTSLLVLDNMQHYKAIKIIQKIPINLTEFDNYIPQRHDTKIPILPNNIPYMVQLYGYIETDDLIFLILQYAPGEKLLNYIKKYINTVPKSPSRKVDINNVLLEPKRVINKEETDLSVNELVENSQKLLLDVDLVLKEDFNKNCEEYKEDKEIETTELLGVGPCLSNRREMIPASTIKEWSAQILLCIEHLHDAGVICRDLNPNNILLGDKGQIVMTYMLGHTGHEATLSVLDRHRRPDLVNMFVAPELYTELAMDKPLDKVCDFWSYGAILYELICGKPLSDYHNSVFTSHTMLYLPDYLTLEESSILSQLLTFLGSSRLGAAGIVDIKQHPYFSTIHWQSVLESWIVPD